MNPIKCACGVLGVVLPLLAGGQVLEFKDIMRLPSNINSGVEESMPLLTPNGKTLYFSRVMDPQNVGGANSGSDVWTSYLDVSTGRWGKPTNTPLNINTKGNNTLVGMNKKGDMLYVLSTYPSKPPKGIYFIQQMGSGWSKPELVRIPDLETDGFLGVFVSPDFDVIFLSMKGPDTSGEEDLYYSLRDSLGRWSRPSNLGTTINTKGFEISPFLSADKKRLYFSSNGHPGSGDADIFYSERLYGSWETWSVPRNLGTEVNSSAFDAYFSVTNDSLGFFASNRSGKLADLYSVKVSLVDRKEEATKKYLTQNETAEYVGAAVMEVRFDKNSSNLNAAQNELLFYISSKVLTKSDIKLQLVTNDSGEQALTQKRLSTVSEKLKSLGMGSYRLDAITAKPTRANPLPDGVVKILLFR